MTTIPPAGNLGSSPDPGPDSGSCSGSGSPTASRLWFFAVLLVIGMFSLEFGSAFAAMAIDASSAGVVVTLRMGLAGLILVILLRPRLRGLSGTDWAWLAGLAATIL